MNIRQGIAGAVLAALSATVPVTAFAKNSTAAPLPSPQVHSHGSTRAPTAVESAPAPGYLVHVRVQAQGRPLSGQTVVVTRNGQTITTAPTGSDGTAQVRLTQGGAYTFHVQGAPLSTKRIFTVKSGAPQSLTLKLASAPGD